MKRINTGISIAAFLLALSAPLEMQAKFLPRIPSAFAFATRDDNDEEGVETARKSKVVPIALPDGAFRSKNKKDIAKFEPILGGIARPNGRDIGDIEVLIWQKAGDIRDKLVRSIKDEGYVYAPQPPADLSGDKVILFACVRDTPKEGKDENKDQDNKAEDGKDAAKPKHDKEAVVGMWINHGGNLLLAWSTANKKVEAKDTPSKAAHPAKTDEDTDTPARADEKVDEKPSKTEKADKADKAENTDGLPPLTASIDAATRQYNIGGTKKPIVPAFPKLAVKPGLVRGYVLDSKGHPLKGALIGVRSTAVGGAYSGASIKTDAKGYYEIQAPWGAAEFYCAGYTTDYGDLVGAFGLYPEDGEKDGFATANGAVKNWVLLPSGVADRAKVQDQPQYSGNYFGGTIVFYYHTDSGSQQKEALPANSEIEITLTPDGPLLGGGKARTIVVRKAVGDGFSGTLYLNNIPVCPYKIKARLVGGGALRMRETGPYANRAFGMTPKVATGEADFLLKVYDTDPNSAVAGLGHWRECTIDLERP